MAPSLDQLLEAAEALERHGQYQQAELLYRTIVQQFPADARTPAAADALARIAAAGTASVAIEPPRQQLDELIAKYNANRKAEALAEAEALSRHYPASVALLNILASAQRGLGRGDAALGTYRKIAELRPDHAEAHYGLAILLQALGRLDEAIASYRRAIAIKPDHAEAFNNLGSCARALGRLDEAVACYERALSIRPDLANISNNLGSTLKALGRDREAIACYQRAIGIDPDFGDAHYNMANALRSLDRPDEAVASYERALRIRPDHAEAHHNLGSTLQDIGREQEAIVSYQRALSIRPDYGAARAQKLQLQALHCDWAAIEAEAAFIPLLGVSGDPVPPYAMLALEDHPERHRIRSERFVAVSFRQAPLAPHVRPVARPERLRIGYFSADYKNHPVGRLIATLVERHDRARFEVHGYAHGPAVNDAVRSRLAGAFDVFRDVDHLDDRAIAEQARRDGIDIAIDLTGHTGRSRTGIFAYRAAPVQISYLGYPGTMGAPFIDFIIADKIVIPKGSERYYSESIIYLPHQYQVQDDRRPLPPERPSRGDLGLPDDGFVYCAINNSYKITPAGFAIWMNLLRQTDRGVLWLLRSSEAAEHNLRNEARKRGVDPARILFAGRKSYQDYLAQFAAADLFLDSFDYNAGATAGDALWAGLPVITRPGLGYTARMAASLLEAIGLPELIAASEQDYERLALDLAGNPAEIERLRSRLSHNRTAMPLFDYALFARHVEDGYDQAHRAWLSGAPFRNIEIA